MKISYLGPNGTFSEQAALKYFRPINDFYLGQTIFDVIGAVGEAKVDKGIVPLENTIEGTINMTIDGLLSFEELFIEGELTIPISLHLLANKESNKDEINEVWSISPILTQCRKYIRNKKLKSLQFDSSASAASYLQKQNKKEAGVIGSEYLADLFDLQVVEREIQDNKLNQTKFVVIGRNEGIGNSRDKVMFVITPNNEYIGILSSILNVFSALSINLSWIESQPTTIRLGTYRFFIEVNSGCDEENINKAITILQTLGHKIRILGRYKCEQTKGE